MWWLIFAFISGLGAAILAILLKVGLKNIDSFILTFSFAISMAVIFFIGGMCLQKFQAFSFSMLTRREVGFLIAANLLNAIVYLTYFTALQYGKAHQVFTIDRLSIVYVVILSIVILHESWNYSVIIGALFMVLGAWLIVA